MAWAGNRTKRDYVKPYRFWSLVDKLPWIYAVNIGVVANEKIPFIPTRVFVRSSETRSNEELTAIILEIFLV